MALTTSYTNPMGGQMALRSPGAIPLTVSTGGGTYATASGGIAVDLTNILTGASQNGIPAGAVIAIYGRSSDGYTATFTFSSGFTWNMRLYTSGASEIADGAVTKTVEAMIWLGAGALP